IEVGKAGIKGGKAFIELGVGLGRDMGAELNRRYELTLRSRQPREPDVEAAGGDLDIASTGNRVGKRQSAARALWRASRAQLS
ncbi:hypothetical protein, partial [Pseudomonas rossensis]|uniref:hypothetical protein n=1 Tax=Pseudomonas rossensis TaxID=2305471 RepID=UPI00326116BD